MTPRPLPKVLVAPNGARRTAADHPAIPVTDAQLIETALACFQAGAGGVHLHLRDADQQHLLDADRYRTLLDTLERLAPDHYLQVTSEAAGRYSSATQQRLIRDLKPRHVSVALREMVREPRDWPEATSFYDWAAAAEIDIQHIVYSPGELSQLLDAIHAGHIPGPHHLLQFVLGCYDGQTTSIPEALSGFTDLLPDTTSGLSFDWMLCAFGPAETDCLLEALRQGGKARIGFENSLWNRDGTIAVDNAERVSELVRLAGEI